jgi:hypothetical protein
MKYNLNKILKNKKFLYKVEYLNIKEFLNEFYKNNIKLNYNNSFIYSNFSKFKNYFKEIEELKELKLEIEIDEEKIFKYEFKFKILKIELTLFEIFNYNNILKNLELKIKNFNNEEDKLINKIIYNNN